MNTEKTSNKANNASTTDTRAQRRGHDHESLWPTRLVALAVSVLIWLFASYLPRLESISEKEVIASLSYTAPPSGMVSTAARRSSVTVRLRGTDDAIAPVGNDSVSVTVPLPDAIEPGVPTEVTLSSENAVLPEGVEIMSFTPATVVVLIDELISENILVQPEFRGEPGAGLTRDDLRFEVFPEQISVSGPRAAIETLATLATDPIDLSGRAIDFSLQIGVQLPDPGLSASPDFVTINVFFGIEPDSPTDGPGAGVSDAALNPAQ